MLLRISVIQQAWTESNKRYGRAMRTLAYRHYHDGDYAKCIECARSALSINTLFPKVWFLLGSASMKSQPVDYDVVIEAFSAIVSIDNTDFEAWNNLGAAHMNLENYKSALYALSEAANLRRRNWKIWENVLTAAMKLKKLSKSISALSHLLEIKKETASISADVVAAMTIELTANITKNQENKDEEKGIASLIKQFDALVSKILNRLSENSFSSESSHEHSSPFTIDGLRNESMMSGIGMNKRAKQAQTAYEIYEIFAIYFRKTMRSEESIETRFKQSRMMMRYFENICKTGQSDKMKANYLKIVHVLDELMNCYAIKMEKDEKDIGKMKEMLTSIQLTLNRAQRLSDKKYVNVEQSQKLMQRIEKMETLTYKMKNETNHKKEEENIINSAFADWI